MATIVFCEDDPTIRKLIQVALRSTAHRVFIAEDGQAGLAVIERERPEIVFTDVSMPEMDGLELMAVLHGRADLAQIPVVLLSASAQQRQIEEGLRHGALGYMTKPFSTAELRAKVDEFLLATLANLSK